MSPRTRLARLVAASTVGVLFAAGVGTPAGAATERRLPPAPVVEIELTNDGRDVPGPLTRPAAPLTFKAHTADTRGHYLALSSLAEGVSFDRVMQLYAELASPDAEVRKVAVQELYRVITFRGGATVFAGDTMTFTDVLTPGTYFIGESPATYVPGRPQYFSQQLTITAPAGRYRLPKVDHQVVIADICDAPRYLMPSRMRAGSSIRLTNRSASPNEIIFMPLKDGMTERDIAAYFAAQNGGDPASYPFTARGSGLPAIDEGLSMIFSINLPPGRYAAMSYLLNPETGNPHGFEGQYKVVTLY